jgi:ribonuclease D
MKDSTPMADLEQIAVLAREAGRVGIDTEFMAEGRYRPQLCLVVVGVDDPSAPNGVRTELIDPLASSPPDPAPLAALFADPSVEVVVHAGRQDLDILRRAWETEVTSVFDTQIAAGFVGLGAGAGYGRLVSGVLKVQLPKGETFAKWDARPLTDDQLAYAHEDVSHLLPLAAELRVRLEQSGRLAWALEECRPLEVAGDVRDPEHAYRRLPRHNQLKPRELSVARELAAWRERTAEAEDRTTNAVLGDAQLSELARRQPQQVRAMKDIRGLWGRTVQRRGDEILEAIQRGVAAPPLKLEDDRHRLDPEAVPLVALGEALVRARSRDSDLAYELIAARADLAAVVGWVTAGRGEEPHVRTLRGWRRELVGEDLIELLRGRRSLAVDGGRLEVTPR